MSSKDVTIHIISDSIGQTAHTAVKSATFQYPQVKFNIIVHNFVDSQEELLSILDRIRGSNQIIVHTLAVNHLNQILVDHCENNDLAHLDFLHPLLSIIEEKTGEQASEVVGAKPVMDESYFERNSAMEFAVSYDDGQQADGLAHADIILLGISRTSKTPLSIYLAYMNYKVANIPLYPEVDVPREIFDIDPKKIIGLTTNLDSLMKIRQERMKSYGMDPNNSYSSCARVQAELEYAENLFDELGCLVIDVTHRSIEETASLILNHLKE